MLLECCVAASADLLITGDKDILDIRDHPLKLKIITSGEFTKKD